MKYYRTKFRGGSPGSIAKLKGYLLPRIRLYTRGTSFKMSGARAPSDEGWIWSNIFASFIVSLCTLGLSNSFGVFQSYYEYNLLQSYSASSISWIGTTSGFLLSIVGLVSGPLYDKGFIRQLMYIGTVMNVVGLLGTSFATKYSETFLSFGIVLGFGCGAIYVPAQAQIQNHFSKKNAPLAAGISLTGSSVGGILYPILFRQLQNRIDFGWTCRVFALINGVLLLVPCLLIRPQKRTEESAKASFNWRVFRDSKLILFSVCAMVMDVAIDVPFYFVPTFVQQRLNLSSEIADSLLAGLNASSLFGRLFLNWLAGYAPSLIVWQFTILGSCVLLFCWFTVESLPGIIAFVICYGFLVGGLIALIPSSLREIFPDEPNIFGARLGLVEGFQGFGFLIGPPIAGAILESPAAYLGVSIFCGVLYLFLFLVVGIFTWKRLLFVGTISETESMEGIELRKTS
ncbi:MFS general substrate transporter [Hypoxylon fuscum]|nr:MFS general substrate transporter [Hypoxylon fuscum]